MSEKTLTQEEWARRYQQRLIDVAALEPEHAADEFNGAGFDYLSEGFEDDPEGAADESMSCWDGE